MNKNICICITEMDSFSIYGWVCVGLMVLVFCGFIWLEDPGFQSNSFLMTGALKWTIHGAEMCVKVHVKSMWEKCV